MVENVQQIKVHCSGGVVAMKGNGHMHEQHELADINETVVNVNN